MAKMPSYLCPTCGAFSIERLQEEVHSKESEIRCLKRITPERLIISLKLYGLLEPFMHESCTFMCSPPDTTCRVFGLRVLIDPGMKDDEWSLE